MSEIGTRVGAWLGIPEAPQMPEPPGPEVLGAIAVDLAWNWASWVNRRVETISFVEDTTVRRSMSVDFTFPSPDELAAPVMPGAQIFVPLQILAKETLMHVDVVNEHGASISTLNTVANADLSSRGLVRFLDALHREEVGVPLPRHSAADLTFIASADRDSAMDRLKVVFAPGAPLAELLGHTIVEAKKAEDDSDATEEITVGEKAEEPERSQKNKQAARPEIQMIEDLAAGFLQLVQVQYRPGLHRVLKVAYDVPQTWSDPSARRWWERGLRAIGSLPRRQTFANANLGQALGYHIEVVAPEDTELVEAKLSGKQWSTASSHPEPLISLAPVRSRSRAHIHARLLAGSEGAADAESLERLRVQGRNDSGELTVALLPRRAGVLTAATLTSVFTAAVLLGFAMRLSHLDGETSAAVLLLVPAVVAAYLSRPGEHPFATRMLIGVRCLALVGGTLAVLMSGMIGAGLMKLEPVRAAPSRHNAVTLMVSAAGAPTAIRCPSSGRMPEMNARRLQARPDCSIVRTRTQLKPALRYRLRPWVDAVSWAAAILAILVAALLMSGYAYGWYFRRAAPR